MEREIAEEREENQVGNLQQEMYSVCSSNLNEFVYVSCTYVCIYVCIFTQLVTKVSVQPLKRFSFIIAAHVEDKKEVSE